MSKVMLTVACRDALREEMARDERVFVMGVDARQGLLGRTKGLFDEFGPNRVINTPITENTVVGAGVGAAATGMVAVIDLQISNFLYVAMDQIMNQAAKLRYMMGGSASFPLTIMAGTGIPGGYAAQHSDTVHSTFMNAAGIKVVYPSNPQDAKGLLKATIRDPNPAIFLTHMTMGGVRGEVPDGDYLTPLGQARVLREGTDVTVVGIGVMAHRALEAAAQLEQEGVSVEVLDPRTLHPLDHDAITASVEKTGRLICVDEGRRTCSAASEIVARVCSDAFSALRAAPQVLANPDMPIPYSPILERQVVPHVEDIVEAVRSMRIGGG